MNYGQVKAESRHFIKVYSGKITFTTKTNCISEVEEFMHLTIFSSHISSTI